MSFFISMLYIQGVSSVKKDDIPFFSTQKPTQSTTEPQTLISKTMKSTLQPLRTSGMFSGASDCAVFLTALIMNMKSTKDKTHLLTPLTD